MKNTLLQILLLSAAALCQAAEDPTESLPGVHDLTPDTFDKVVNGGKHALVEFYAPWCGHCKHLTPEYKKLGEAVAADPKLKNRVVVAKVDADAHRELGERFDVKGFPTIKFFSRGKSTASPEDYSGGRTSDAFLAFLNEKITTDRGFARIESFDALASSFLTAADTSGAAAAIKAAAEKLGEGQQAAGTLYSKFAEKASTKGMDWFKTETERLERLLSGGKVGGSKIAEISQKLSVLTAFLPAEEGDMTKDSAAEKATSAEE